MTTIAWDGKTLAGDRCSWSGPARRHVRKVFKIKAKDGKDFLVGFCGDGAFALAVLAWMRGEGHKPSYHSFGVHPDTQCAMVIDKDLTVWGLGAALTYYRFDEKMMAMGGGQEFAWGALEAGATAQQAIEITIKRSDHAGFGVDCVSFEDDEEAQ